MTRPSPSPLPAARLHAAILAALLAALAAPARGEPAPDTLTFAPVPAADTAATSEVTFHPEDESEWLRAPFGDNLLTAPEPWRSRHPHGARGGELLVDYNRVDLLRYGARVELQSPETLYPRIGGRFEYATGRRRTLYGVQFEQPLLPTGRFVLGASMTRRTDHSELQQVDDLENSLALLFAREDYRDYFEREGGGVYVAWRVPGFSTVSVHARRDQFRSLPMSAHVTSWFNSGRTLRPNPAVDEGESHTLALRLERLARRTRHTRAGLYHWIEVERAGGRLGGDFDYTRAIADVRSVVRLMPAVTLSLRAVGGATAQGVLPVQKQFTAGGVDGLRAHPFGSLRGDELALGQAEYAVGLWHLHSGGVRAGVNALAFMDTGTAWTCQAGRWDVGRQKFAVDGGFGLATSEDGARVYFARDLQDPDSKFVVTLRLQRPF